MADVKAFRGIRYDSSKVGDIGRVICPPYDVINSDERLALLRQSPWNVVRLELGEDCPGDDSIENRYTRAAASLSQWLLEGVLIQEDLPAMYIVREEFSVANEKVTRHSLLATVRLENFDQRVILPHERTTPKPKQDRLDLLKACETNISPLMALYRDSTGRVDSLLNSETSRSPDEQFSLADGRDCSMWIIRETTTLQAYQEAFKSLPLYLADGHHRYETALTYRDMMRRDGTNMAEMGSSYGLMALISFEDPGLRVYPYHRMLSGLDSIALKDLGQKVDLSFNLEPETRQSSSHPVAETLIGHLEEAKSKDIIMGIVGLHPSGPSIVRIKSSKALDALKRSSPSDAFLRCETWVLEELLLQPTLTTNNAATLTYVHDPDQALGAISRGEAQIVFLLRAIPLDVMETIVQEGWVLPPKSTYFSPKIITGLVMHHLD